MIPSLIAHAPQTPARIWGAWYFLSVYLKGA